MNITDKMTWKLNDRRFDRVVMSVQFFAIVTLVAIALVALITRRVPTEDRDLLTVAVTGLLMRLGTMVDFWHGGSRSSVKEQKPD